MAANSGLNACKALIVVHCILILAPAFAVSPTLEQPTQEIEWAKPADGVDLSPWGFVGLSPLARFTLRANITVDFLDADRLLITFNAKKLMIRNPECLPSHKDRFIHAMILDLQSRQVQKATDWYVHDERRYLWPLGDGNFLLRRLNSFYEVDSALHERTLYTAPRDVLWANVTSDGKQLILEFSVDERSASQQAQSQSGRARVVIQFLDLQSGGVKNEMQATGILPLEATGSGYADSTRGRSGKTWLVRYGANANERRDLARVKSPCEPNLLFPTPGTLFVGRCSPSQGSDYSVSVFTITGHPLWRQRWSQSRHPPSLQHTADDSRFAVSSFAGIAEPTPPPKSEDTEEWPAVEQTVRVFETASGNPVLFARIANVILQNQNFSLSPDGSRLALLDGSLLELYNLPTMSTEERAKLVAMKADAPALAAPLAPRSGEVDEAEDSLLGNPDAAEDRSALNANSGLTAPTDEGKPLVDATNSSGAPDVPAASGGDTAGDPSTSPTGTIKASTEEVVVDVVVTDPQGHPVKNLRQQDFQLQEDGKAQRIGYFHEFNTAGGAVTAAPAVSPQPNVFTNNVAVHLDRPVVVIVLDFLNTPFTDQQYAKQQLLKFVKNKPTDAQFALCVLTDRLRLVHGLTSDENGLTASITNKKSRIRFSSALQGNEYDPIIRAEKQAAESDFYSQYMVQQLQQLQIEERARQVDLRMSLTTSAFAQLARYLSGIPGRKNLVWLSAAFPSGFFGNVGVNRDTPNMSSEVRNYGEQIREATNLLAKAHVAVYPVDVRGVTSPSVFSSEMNVDPTGAAAPGSNMQGPPGRTPAPPMQGVNTAMNVPAPTPLLETMNLERDSSAAEQATMDQVAADTGGKAFYNSNGVEQAIRTAVEQGSQYYMLSYSPANRQYDGSFRKIKVSLSHKGYRLAYRRGYYAVDPTSLANDAFTPSIAAALQHASPQSRQVLFAVRIVPVGKALKIPVTSPVSSSGRDKRTESGMVEVQRYSIDYAIPASHIRFSANNDVHHAVLDFAYSAFDDKGSVLTRTAVQCTSDLNAAKYRDAVIGGLRMHQQAEIPVTATALRVGVQDELGRRLGTLELPLPVKAPADDPTARTRSLPPVEPE